MRYRKNVEALSADEINDLRRAFSALQASTDPTRNYSHFAAIHGGTCPHGCDLFLPWHRAYLQEFEDALRTASGLDVTVPYWNWITTRQIPAIFADPNSNPLWHERYTDTERPSWLDLPSAADLDRVMHKRQFSDFGGSGFGTPYPQVGDLEQCLHGWVHLWVGGSMADMMYYSAPCDPLFWAHHANVDRLWALWQDANPGSGPTCLTAALPGLNNVWTVQDSLDRRSARLGYEYVDSLSSASVRDKLVRDGATLIVSLPAQRSPYQQAELYLKGVRASATAPAPVLLTVTLSLFDQSFQSSFPLFGLHHHLESSRMNAPMRHGQMPCFPPQQHRSPCGDQLTFKLSITDFLKRPRPEGEAMLHIQFSLLAPDTKASALGLSIDSVAVLLHS